MTFNTKKYKLTMLMSLIISVVCAVLIFAFLAFPMYMIMNEHMVKTVLVLIGISAATFCCTYFYFTRKYRRRKKILKTPFPAEWEYVLNNDVAYYQSLNDEQKRLFKQEMLIFLGEKTLTGIETEIDDKTMVLTAASAIIPVMSFPEWEYDNLSEILIYPTDFDENYNFSGKGGNILGLVTGGGSTMILSKTSLLHGFKNYKDKLNVGIHEFIHKVDGEDGAIDGVPSLLTDKATTKEWLDIMEKEAELMKEGKSDINPYGLTNNAEFFAVTSEYFFENPKAMESKHPELYRILQKMFRQDTKSMFASVVKSMFRPGGKKLGRNDPCPCGSGKKYKKCCLDKKYRR